MTGQSLPNDTRAPERSRLRDLVLPGAAGGADAGQGQLGHQRVGLGPQRLEVRDHAEVGEAGQVGRVDELDVRHGGPAVGRAVAPGRLGDRVQGQADTRRRRWRARGPGSRAASAAAIASASSSGVQLAIPCECGQSSYGWSSAAVPASTTPSAKNFTVRAVSQPGGSAPVTRSRSAANSPSWSFHSGRLGPERQVGAEPQRAGVRGGQPGVYLAVVDPGVLDPGDPGGREQRRYLGQRGGLLAQARHREQVQDRADGPPLAQGA